MKRTLSIVGAGRVGRTLGKRLRERGWRIGAVVTRSTATSRAAVRAIGAGTPLVWGGSARLILAASTRVEAWGFIPTKTVGLQKGLQPWV